MASFPKLKTNAVMQYPARRHFQFSNQVIRFLDGSEQRYRDYGAALRRWIVRLDMLDEGELAALENFFIASQGKVGSFSFTDPWDGAEYSDCSLEGDEFQFELQAEMRGETELVVRENRV
jgi:hypothetical protein